MMDAENNPDTINSDDRISEIAALILQAILRLRSAQDTRNACEKTYQRMI